MVPATPVTYQAGYGPRANGDHSQSPDREWSLLADHDERREPLSSWKAGELEGAELGDGREDQGDGEEGSDGEEPDTEEEAEEEEESQVGW